MAPAPDAPVRASAAADVLPHATAMARAALPREACGLLGGRMTGARIEIEVLEPVANTSPDPRRFALDPAGMLIAEDRIDDAGLRVVGVMHSHPAGEAVPSPTDLDDAAGFDPDSAFVHLIVSMQGFVPTARLWRFPGANGPADPTEIPLDRHG